MKYASLVTNVNFTGQGRLEEQKAKERENRKEGRWKRKEGRWKRKEGRWKMDEKKTNKIRR